MNGQFTKEETWGDHQTDDKMLSTTLVSREMQAKMRRYSRMTIKQAKFEM